ncbi:MAG: type IV pilus twitching motility protein PilT [Immundisolibacter sp.]|uniref:type IV pilus twitching motility protein PilT n=1 Tax=Immundisolibacter sp. TaxID=1934948 RepID=UPI003EDFCAC4
MSDALSPDHPQPGTTARSPVAVQDSEAYLRYLMTMAVESRVSDLHLKAGLPPYWRHLGELDPIPDQPVLVPQDVAGVAAVLMSERHTAQFNERQQVDLAYGVTGIGRLRANIYRQRGSVAMALRVIPTEIPSAADLALPAAIELFSKTKRGMVLITGATGSGKSTTLAALIEIINKRDRRHVVTIEDPIEYLFKDKKSVVNQREVGIDTSGFGDALRAALRQDPDVIFIGELRDAETITTAVRASETGHLVISTLHAPNCYDAITRLLSYFPPQEQDTQRKAIAANLRGIVSQRLLPRADGSGRVAAFEVMVVTPTIADMIEDPQRQSDIYEVIKSGKQHAMVSFDDYLYDLVESGQISRDTALANASNVTDLRLRFQGF